MEHHCQIEIEIKGGEKLECGGEATGKVTLVDKATKTRARVDVCAVHKAQHSSHASAMRVASKSSS